MEKKVGTVKISINGRTLEPPKDIGSGANIRGRWCKVFVHTIGPEVATLTTVVAFVPFDQDPNLLLVEECLVDYRVPNPSNEWVFKPLTGLE